MPFSVHREKGERYYRYSYYFDDSKKRVRGSTRRSTKEAATKYAKQLFEEAQLERDGLGPTKAARDASKKELILHLNDFLDAKEKEGKASKYVKGMKKQLTTLFQACAWTFAKDIRRDGFEAWRGKQTLHPKTVNEYHWSLSSFVNWLLGAGRLSVNPLAHIAKVATKGAESRKRRAFTMDEVERLRKVSGRRAVVYVTAAFTGLRRGELQKIEWRDIELAAVNPLIRARASTTKNGKEALLPLHPNVVQLLQSVRPATVAKGDLVFKGLIPRMPRFHADMKAAGITPTDEQGRVADFHSLRNTFATILTLNGKPQREIMELMRHSDMRLTAKVYTDAGQLPLAQTVASLPGLDGLKVPGQNAWQESVQKRQTVARDVQVNSGLDSAHNVDFEPFVTECRDVANGADGARCRVRTCDPCRVKAMLYH
jgi:integrase